MGLSHHLKELGFSQYETKCYLTLVAHNSVNGSRLSRLSGVPRSKIYDVLTNMSRKGLVMEVEGGLWVPLPPEEFMKRLRSRFESVMSVLREELDKNFQEKSYEYVWAIRGYDHVMAKAREMINTAREEIYLRLAPEEESLLHKELQAAEARGATVKFISLGQPTSRFKIQVLHPDSDKLTEFIGGRSIDIITDTREALVGMFETGNQDDSVINWTRNRWFIISSRDSLRHDFFHYLFHKMYELGQALSESDKEIYDLIKSDAHVQSYGGRDNDRG